MYTVQGGAVTGGGQPARLAGWRPTSPVCNEFVHGCGVDLCLWEHDMPSLSLPCLLTDHEHEWPSNKSNAHKCTVLYCSLGLWNGPVFGVLFASARALKLDAVTTIEVLYPARYATAGTTLQHHGTFVC
jgi:hypothetical protein